MKRILESIEIDPNETRMVKKLAKLNDLANKNTILNEYKENHELKDVYNLDYKFSTNLQNEWNGELNQKLKIKFDYKEYHIVCEQSMYFHKNEKTKEYDLFCFSIKQHELYIAFYEIKEIKENPKAKRRCVSVTNLKIEKQQFWKIFDFIHFLSFELCKYDPFATVYYDCDNIFWRNEGLNCYQLYQKDYTNGYKMQRSNCFD